MSANRPLICFPYELLRLGWCSSSELRGLFRSNQHCPVCRWKTRPGIAGLFQANWGTVSIDTLRWRVGNHE